MDEKIVKVIIESFIKELVSESKIIFTTLYDEGKHFVGFSIKKYLERHKTKFTSLKTLLRGNTPVFLYDIYYPLKLTNFKKTIDTDSTRNLFTQGNYVTIIGDAGSGKSTLVKHLFLTAIKEKFAIPVLIELRYLNRTAGDLECFISQQIFDNKVTPNASILERLYNKGKFLFFLDGFDELNKDVRAAVIESLNNFIGTYENNKFIITSRPYSNIENLESFRNFQVKNLTEIEIDGFIDLQLKTETELAEKIKFSIKQSKSSYIKSFLTNPLLLTLYILTFQTYAEIPDKKYIFYRRVINALFSEHDSKTKLGYVREKQSQLTQEQFEEILKAFSFISYFGEHFDFDYDYIDTTLASIKKRIESLKFDNSKFITDLKSAVALWVEDNGKYSFAHRSLQEYFAASFIKNLNPDENARAYQKIIHKFSEVSKPMSEYKNFLSLCNEMDEINFYQYYYLPLLKELRSYLDNSSRKNLTASFVDFFTNHIELNGERTHRIIQEHQAVSNPFYTLIEVKEIVYKTIYIHLEFTKRLFELLQQTFIEVGKDIIDQKKFTKMPKIEFRTKEEIAKHCIDSKFYAIANEFLVFIENEINDKEKFIKQALKSDRDLLDLI